MPVNSRGPRRRRSWWCHTCSSTPSTRTPAKRAGSSDAACRHGLMWDHTVFHVVASCRARPAIVAPSKRSCRIAQRIARAPRRARGAHIRSSCSRNVTVWQVVSRHIHRRIVPPDPCRDPGPGRVNHLYHHTPVTLRDHPTTRAANQLVARLNIEHQSPRGASHTHQMEALQTDEQITPITTIKRHGVAGRERHRPSSLTTAGVEVRSSSRTSTSTRNTRPTPTHPYSTRKSQISAGLTNGDSMSILINMPTKNIYVSEADVELFERAAQHAESVSAAVVQALQEYLTNRHNTERGYGKIELALYENGLRRKVMFYGREIVRVERPVDGGVQINTIYETVKGQLAVATKIRRLLPDEVKRSYRIWDHPETWSREFWLIGDKTLDVYPDIAQLELVDAYLAEQCKSALSAKPYEVLDI